MKAPARIIAGQPCWILRGRSVELAVTQLGGHMAPVTFFRNTARPVRPYYISPWQREGRKITEPVLVPLRGDFFCLPFGGGSRGGQTHRVHGETAGAKWAYRAVESAGRSRTLVLTLKTRVCPGRVTKRLTIINGQNVVYCRHVLEGYGGTMPLGHHATLALPEKPGAMRVATSRFAVGLTSPGVVGDPAKGEYQSLASGKRFADLSRVPTIWKEPARADLTRHPARTGFTDIAAVFKKPSATPAWTAAIVESAGYLWFSLKDPAVLPATVLWIANGGRHDEPWLGRNRCIGLEDVCGLLAMGLGPSTRRNEINRAGIPTAVRLSKRRPTVINYIQGAVKVPRGFTDVRNATFAEGKVTFHGPGRRKVTARVDWRFLHEA